MKKKIVSALLTATMVCGMSVVPAVGVAAADDTNHSWFLTGRC